MYRWDQALAASLCTTQLLSVPSSCFAFTAKEMRMNDKLGHRSRYVEIDGFVSQSCF